MDLWMKRKWRERINVELFALLNTPSMNLPLLSLAVGFLAGCLSPYVSLSSVVYECLLLSFYYLFSYLSFVYLCNKLFYFILCYRVNRLLFNLTTPLGFPSVTTLSLTLASLLSTLLKKLYVYLPQSCVWICILNDVL